MNGIFRIRKIRILGRSPNCAIISSNFVAIPKKYGPFISYTSTPFGMIRCSSCVSISDSLFGSISSVMTEISVVSMTRFINNMQAMTSPVSMATVKSKMTVRKNVMSKTVTSDLGLRKSPLKTRHPLILYETITKTPARHAIGIYCARGMRKSKINKRIMACIIPDTGERPPLFIFVIVRAMAPVAGIPPNIGETMFAMP